MNLAACSDADLLRVCQQGDASAAIDHLIERHRQLVFRIALRVTGDRDDAEDVTQECSVALARTVATLHAPLEPWLTTVASRCALNLVRRRTSEQKRRQDMAEISTPRGVPLLPPASDVWESLDDLDERQRYVITRIHIDGAAQADVAREWGVHQASVSRYLSDATEALRQALLRRGYHVTVAVLIGVLSGIRGEAGELSHQGAIVSASVGASSSCTSPWLIWMAAIATALAGVGGWLITHPAHGIAERPTTVALTPTPMDSTVTLRADHGVVVTAGFVERWNSDSMSLTQSDPRKRPRLAHDRHQRPCLRFDGVDDVLVGTLAGSASQEVTISVWMALPLPASTAASSWGAWLLWSGTDRDTTLAWRADDRALTWMWNSHGRRSGRLVDAASITQRHALSLVRRRDRIEVWEAGHLLGQCTQSSTSLPANELQLGHGSGAAMIDLGRWWQRPGYLSVAMDLYAVQVDTEAWTPARIAAWHDDTQKTLP